MTQVKKTSPSNLELRSVFWHPLTSLFERSAWSSPREMLREMYQQMNSSAFHCSTTAQDFHCYTVLPVNTDIESHLNQSLKDLQLWGLCMCELQVWAWSFALVGWGAPLCIFYFFFFFLLMEGEGTTNSSGEECSSWLGDTVPSSECILTQLPWNVFWRICSSLICEPQSFLLFNNFLLYYPSAVFNKRKRNPLSLLQWKITTLVLFLIK